MTPSLWCWNRRSFSPGSESPSPTTSPPPDHCFTLFFSQFVVTCFISLGCRCTYVRVGLARHKKERGRDGCPFFFFPFQNTQSCGRCRIHHTGVFGVRCFLISLALWSFVTLVVLLYFCAQNIEAFSVQIVEFRTVNSIRKYGRSGNHYRRIFFVNHCNWRTTSLIPIFGGTSLWQ